MSLGSAILCVMMSDSTRGRVIVRRRLSVPALIAEQLLDEWVVGVDGAEEVGVVLQQLDKNGVGLESALV